MDSHLVAIEVGVEGRGDKWMQLNCRTLDQDRFKCLDTQTMQCGRTVQQDRTFANHAFQRFPHFGTVALDQATRSLYVGCVIVLHETRDHKWTVQFESHALGQTTLIEFQLWAYHDH